MAGLLNRPASALPETGIDLVSAELRRWAAEPFDRLNANCGISVLDYVERVTGRVLVPRPHGRFGIALALLLAGNFETLCANAMAMLGCALTDAPERGDVGLGDFGLGPTACLFTGRLWAARSASGAVFKPVEPIKAWRVPCPRR